MTTQNSAGNSPLSQLGLVLAASVGALWILALASLVIGTANPVTLNRDQIVQSDLVVRAIVDDLSSGTCSVKQVWKSKETPETVRVRNLADTAARPQGEYLLPLTSRGSDAWDLTSTRLPNRQPLIYPATPEALTQLQQILE